MDWLRKGKVLAPLVRPTYGKLLGVWFALIAMMLVFSGPISFSRFDSN